MALASDSTHFQHKEIDWNTHSRLNTQALIVTQALQHALEQLIHIQQGLNKDNRWNMDSTVSTKRPTKNIYKNNSKTITGF